MNLRKAVLIVFGSVVFFVCSFFAAPMIGSTSIDLGVVFRWPIDPRSSVDAAIFWTSRVPRVCLAALAGAALSAAGVAFQAILRNPLATPYTLGVSSGASFGAVLALVLGVTQSVWGISGLEILSFSGALGTIFLVFKLGSRGAKTSAHILLLAGVTIAFFFSALIMFLQYLADFTQTYQIIHWMMGGLDAVEPSAVTRTAPWIAGALMILLVLSRDFDLIAGGTDYALSKGVNVERTRRITYFAASFATAAVVSLCGPIGFVGLIVPHTVRLLTGPGNRLLLICSIFWGAGFLIICDTVARTLFSPAELPIGVLTAMLGGPFFLFLLLKLKKKTFI